MANRKKNRGAVTDKDHGSPVLVMQLFYQNESDCICTAGSLGSLDQLVWI